MSAIAPSSEIFAAHVEPVLTRFLAQNALAPLDAVATRAYADALRREGEAFGWAQVQKPGGGELSDEWVKAAIARVLAALPAPRVDLAPVTKQLLKGCYQPDYVPCRESYCETTSGGECRRQALATALGRASGTHCVDCPYWRELSPEQHGEWLAARWVGDVGEFHADRAVFLPEDFRALRRVARGEW